VDTWLNDFSEDCQRSESRRGYTSTDDPSCRSQATAARLGDLVEDVTVLPVEGGPQTSAGSTRDSQQSASSASSRAHTRLTERNSWTFLVEFEGKSRTGLRRAKIEARNLTRLAAAMCGRRKTLLRLWKPPAGTRPDHKNLGLY